MSRRRDERLRPGALRRCARGISVAAVALALAASACGRYGPPVRASERPAPAAKPAPPAPAQLPTKPDSTQKPDPTR